VDFDELKDTVKNAVDIFDHSLIIEKDTLMPKTLEALTEEGIRMIELEFRTTAENFAKYFYDVISDRGYKVKRVSVYETPNNCATYCED
jgi:6-pyruvoyltetrahydropterin/6-carboxytetrahydropterin synthase